MRHQQLIAIAFGTIDSKKVACSFDLDSAIFGHFSRSSIDAVRRLTGILRGLSAEIQSL
ncbi:MAG: hypothetical protein GY807_10165 [Gammaproteobacteria bacterium]|nr:hypothetical protein [Gammaproteobacteria bacterium]